MSNNNDATYSPEEMMAIAASRKFRNDTTCFVGVGLPGMAACAARELDAPHVRLVYESGAIGAKPTVAPLSIADPELAETADFIVSVHEIFSFWLQGGRIDVAFLGAGQLDRFGNINSTVIGSYDSPKVRMPGAGGAPQITTNVREAVVIVRHSPKAFVSRLDFLTSPRCKGPTTAVTDLGILETDPATTELVVTSLHPGVTAQQIQEATGWPVHFARNVTQTAAPSARELSVLRDLKARTQRAHGMNLQLS